MLSFLLHFLLYSTVYCQYASYMNIGLQILEIPAVPEPDSEPDDAFIDSFPEPEFLPPTKKLHQQKADHFNPNDTLTWKQLYLEKKHKNQQPNGPVILLVGGENPMDHYWLDNEKLPHNRLANRINASVYLLEHRHYGGSQPKKNLSLFNLQTLSPEQAVEDIGAFIDHVNKETKMEKPKWIAIGGSYAGNLAAWSRARHPRKIRAAIASSAPIVLQTEYPEFTNHLEETLKGKDADCWRQIRYAFLEMRKHMKTAKGKEELVKVFKLDKALLKNRRNLMDENNFYFLIRNFVIFIVQYSDVNAKMHRNDLNIERMCSTMAEEQRTPMENLRSVVEMVLNATGHSNDTQIEVSYSKYVNYMRNMRKDLESGQPRAWLYQSCSQLGHFIPSLNTNGMFLDTIPMSFFHRRCRDVFGTAYSAKRMKQNISNTNKEMNGEFNVSRVIFVTGEYDPWIGLTVTNTSKFANLTDDNTIIVIPGVAHSADLYPLRKTDGRGLREAQKQIEDTLLKYLEDDEEQPYSSDYGSEDGRDNSGDLLDTVP